MVGAAMNGPEGTSQWDALVNEYHDALDRIATLEAALREVVELWRGDPGRDPVVLLSAAVGIANRALESSDG